MPNPEHVEIVRQGKEAIDAWREAHPNEIFDLRGAKLGKTDLRGADLEPAKLRAKR